MLQGQARAVDQNKDPSQWFEVHETQMKGTVTMRKTENGWRALGAD